MIDPKEVVPSPFTPGAACKLEDLRPRRIDQGISDVYWQVPIGRLWHYTSWESFAKIIDSRSLHASDLRYLNDTREYMHAVEVLRWLVERMARGLAPLEAEFLQRLATGATAVSQVPPVFVFSLSEVGDDLDQWRAYCPDQGGVAIGFETGRLQMHAEREGFKLVQCIYGPADQERRVQELLDQTIANYRSTIAQGCRWDIASNEGAEHFSRQFVELAPTLKHSAFVNEREWRLVCANIELPSEHKIKARHRRGTLVPYLSIPFASNPPEVYPWPIPWLIVGPTEHPHLANNAAYAAVRSAWDDNYWAQAIGSVLLVFNTEVPYRGWW